MIEDLVQLMTFLSGTFFNAFDIGSDYAVALIPWTRNYNSSARDENEDERTKARRHKTLSLYTIGALLAGGLLQTIGIVYLRCRRNPHLMALPTPLRRLVILLSPTLLSPILLYLYLVRCKVLDIRHAIRVANS